MCPCLQGVQGVYYSGRPCILQAALATARLPALCDPHAVLYLSITVGKSLGAARYHLSLSMDALCCGGSTPAQAPSLCTLHRLISIIMCT